MNGMWSCSIDLYCLENWNYYWTTHNHVGLLEQPNRWFVKREMETEKKHIRFFLRCIELLSAEINCWVDTRRSRHHISLTACTHSPHQYKYNNSINYLSAQTRTSHGDWTTRLVCRLSNQFQYGWKIAYPMQTISSSPTVWPTICRIEILIHTLARAHIPRSTSQPTNVTMTITINSTHNDVVSICNTAFSCGINLSIDMNVPAGCRCQSPSSINSSTFIPHRIHGTRNSIRLGIVRISHERNGSHGSYLSSAGNIHFIAVILET